MDKNGLTRLQQWILIQAYIGTGRLEKRNILDGYFKTDNKRFDFVIAFTVRELTERGLVTHESLASNTVFLTEEGKNLADEMLRERPCLLL